MPERGQRTDPDRCMPPTFTHIAVVPQRRESGMTDAARAAGARA